jgi:hypothetical protein
MHAELEPIAEGMAEDSKLEKFKEYLREMEPVAEQITGNLSLD